MEVIKKICKNPGCFIIFLLAIGLLVPLIGLLSMSVCDKESVNSCLIEKKAGFSDFFYQYNTVRYIYQYQGRFPSGYLHIGVLDNFDGTPVEGDKRIIYHAPLYYYYATFLYLIAKKIDVSDIFLIYFGSLVLFFFTNVFFFLNVKYISKNVFKKIDNAFIVYSLIIFLFLPVHLFLSIGVQSDIAMYFLFMVALFYYFKLVDNKNPYHSIILGLILGVSLLSSITSSIIIAGFIYQMIYLHFKKEKKLRNYLFISLLISAGVGAYPFIRNFVLFNNVLGDMRYEAAIRIHKSFFNTFLRVFRAFWGGVWGGNADIKIALVLFIVILCILVIAGIILYFKKCRDNSTNILLMVGVSILITSFLFMCDIAYLFKHGVCQGDTIQSRYLSPLNPLIAVFASITLTKIKDFIKYKWIKVFIALFVSILALFFIIDYLTAIFRFS
jgi:hypothetical protein